tara:strand:- start:828 stop:1784 length:957 start_codon:yes stop_codon:yes gene_type:complete
MSDPKKGTGKKPKGSSRRLYTDENPKDTVSVKFKTVQDIKDTLSKASFKSKSHKRQSQIINLIHQRARAAYQNAKDPKVKARLKKSFDYAKERKEASKRKTKRMNKNEIKDIVIQELQSVMDEKKKKAGTESSKESSLSDWFGRKGAKGKKGGWVDCNAPDGDGGYKACGREKGEKRSKYPACRPTPGACKEKGKGKSWGKKAKKKEGLEMDRQRLMEIINEELENVYYEYLAEGETLEEAEYQGRKVTLNKPTKGDVKKSKVYVKNAKGNVVKVNFGDPNMKIKKNIPARRKSFRARHNCDNPGPKWKARYWSCKAW